MKLKIVYPNTLSGLVGCFNINLNRIEIAKELKNNPKFDYLHKTILKHELEHSKAHKDKKWLKQFWIDIKDRPKFYYDQKLRDQYAEFSKYWLPKTPKDMTIQIFYELFSSLYGISLMFVFLPIIIYRIFKKVLKK